MAKEKRLGRGLEALLGISGTAAAESEPVNKTEESSTQPDGKIDITKIVPNPFQPRKVFDEAELEQLAQSLQVHGLLFPIAVRHVEQRYQIVAGERRFRAALRLGWNEIPVQFCEADDRQMAELALTENIQRKDLNAIEKAASFANYLETYPGTTHEELASRLGVDRSTVTNLLRLLKLPEQLQNAVCQEKLTTGHVRALLGLENEREQIEVAAKVQTEGWSVRETERFVQDVLQTGRGESPKNPGEHWQIVDQDGETRAVPRQSEQVQQLENDFRHCLGSAKVKLVQTNEKGKGKLTISFANHAEFDQIYAVICKSSRAVG